MKRLLLLLFTTTFIALDSYSTHVAGGVIEVQCQSGNTFNVTVRIYRDPTGVGLPGNIALTIDPVGAGSNTSVNLIRDTIITNLMPPFTNPCLIPPPNANTEEHIYSGTMTLTPGTGYYLYWQCANCRNSTVNVQGQPGVTIFAEVPDPAIYPCNNSPVFNLGPPVSVCINEPMTYDNSAIDSDGDVLVYSFCNALNTGAPPFPSVPYQNPYSGTYPVASAPPLSINPNTGIITGTPNLAGRWIFSVCVEEYRNGIKIGHYVRDVQMTVSSCNIPVTADIGTNYTSVNLGIDVIAACKSYTVNFVNTSTAGTSITYFWDFGVPGITTDTSSLFSPTYTYPDTGTYTVTLISNPGFICADTIQQTVIVYPYINADFTFSSPTCVGSPIQFFDSTQLDYGTTNWWIWNFGAQGVPPAGGQNPSRTYTTPGNYNVRLIVESSKGCRDTVIKTVSVFNPPVVNINPSFLPYCQGGSVVIPTTGNANSWQWTPAAGLSCDTCQNPIANPATPTQYTLVGTGPGGCTSQAIATVIPILTPIVSAGPDHYLCGVSNVTLNGSIQVQPGGVSGTPSWSPATGLSSTTILTPVASPTQTTTYVLTVTTNSNPQCIIRDTVTVFVNAVNMSVGPNQIICPGDTAQLQGTTTVMNPVFSWTPALTLSDPTIPNPLAFPSTTTAYTLTVTDTTTGCFSSSVVLINISPLPTINAGNDRIICINSQTQLQATGGTSYIWDADPTLSCTNCPNPVASPAATRTYYVTGFNTFGCENRDSVTVTVVQPVVPTTSPNTTICTGTSVQISASGGVAYSWAPGSSLSNPAIANPIATPLVNTTYTVTMTDANGCVADGTVEVNLRPLPNVDAGQSSTICQGDTAQLSASGALSYSWTPATTLSNPAIANPQAYPNVNTWYTVQGTDQFGCVNRDSVLVTVNSLQAGNFSPDSAICIGGSYQLFANGFVTYQWSPAASLSNPNISNPVATPSATTTYTVVVADANNCVDSGTVTVTVNPLPVPVIIAGSDTICRFSPTTLTASGGTQYQWLPGTGLSCSTCPNPTASPATTTTYTLRATDANGCQNTSDQTITVIPLPTTDAGVDQTICAGESVQLQATGAVGYSWSPAIGLSCTACPEPVATPAYSTTYVVTGTGQFGCTLTDSIRITVNPLPVVVVNPAQAVLCEGETQQLSAGGGTSYQWSPAATLSNANIPNPVASPLQSTVYTVVASNSFGCIDSAFSDIVVATPASLNLTPDTAVCPGQQVQLYASGGVNYSWAPPIELSDPNIANPVASPTQPRTYTLDVTDSNGCAISATVQIDIFVPADPMAGTDTTVCFGEAAPLTAFNGAMYNWEPSATVDDPSAAGTLAFPTGTTTYTVSIVDANGCSNTDEVTITVQPLPVVSAGPDVTIREGEGVSLSATGAQTYLWWPALFISDPTLATIFVVLPDSTMMYVEGTDAFGCSNIDSVMVNVVPRPKLYIPNAFSPNGDGINDEFLIGHHVSFTLISLRVFNRWGEIVFETSDIGRGWDGRSADGQPAPIDTYIYMVEGFDELGVPVFRKGNVTLIR